MSLLLASRAPPTREGVDLRCCGAEEMLATAPMADVVIADPPWTYERVVTVTDGAARGMPTDHYACLSIGEIVAQLAAARARRLVLWTTWPILPEWTAATASGWPWRLVTGGAWAKSTQGDIGHYGPGYHWAGCSEPVLVYTGRATPHTDRAVPLRNAWVEAPGLHSRKPARWMAQWVQRWCPPGGLVVDPYAGLGSVAEAVILAGEGRRYIGAEIDPERHAAALALAAQVRR